MFNDICHILYNYATKQQKKTKTKMQQLSEGNIELRPAIKHRRKKKKPKTKKQKKPEYPTKTSKQH